MREPSFFHAESITAQKVQLLNNIKILRKSNCARSCLQMLLEPVPEGFLFKNANLAAKHSLFWGLGSEIDLRSGAERAPKVISRCLRISLLQMQVLGTEASQ